MISQASCCKQACVFTCLSNLITKDQHQCFTGDPRNHVLGHVILPRRSLARPFTPLDPSAI
jgi:hypothetical protein